MSTIIKADRQDSQLVRRLETIHLTDHLVEASRIVAEARNRAGRMLEQANAAAVRIREETLRQSREEGYAKGYAEGAATAREEALREATERFRAEQADLCRVFSSAVSEIDGMKRDLLIEAQRDMLEFAVRVAEKIAKRTVALDASSATANLQDVLRLVGAATDLTIRVSPCDAETMRRFAAELVEELGEKTHVRIEEDESIGPGGCVVKTDRAEVDATIASQLDQIVSLLLNRPATPQNCEGSAGEKTNV
jgi:flagellar assembly protein FliH